MLDGVDYSSTSEYLGDLDNLPKTTTTTTRRKSKNKRRFSDDQIRSLEVTFESETKLEPRKKAQLASELGLQPRQVAIWFQNKRARWKSKQTEKEYGSLLANYNSLASQFESLKKDNQSLLVQLQKLRNEMEGNPENKNCNFEIQEPAGNYSSSTTDGESDYTKIDLEAKTSNISSMLSEEDDSSMKAEFLAPLGTAGDNELLKMVETGADSPLTSADDWGSLDSDDLINQPTDQTYQWWDFWS